MPLYNFIHVYIIDYMYIKWFVYCSPILHSHPTMISHLYLIVMYCLRSEYTCTCTSFMELYCPCTLIIVHIVYYTHTTSNTCACTSNVLCIYMYSMCVQANSVMCDVTGSQCTMPNLHTHRPSGLKIASGHSSIIPATCMGIHTVAVRYRLHQTDVWTCVDIQGTNMCTCI